MRTKDYLFPLVIFLHIIGGFGSIYAQSPDLSILDSNIVDSIIVDSTPSILVPCYINEVALPHGFHRLQAEEGTYQSFIQNFPLKADTTIYLYNGEQKADQSFGHLVLDIDIGEDDLQQCADAAIRLRAEYLFANESWADIHFNFTSGDKAAYTEWRDGIRPIVYRNRVRWAKKENCDSSYQNFRNYLNTVFYYAGSWSLDQELKRVDRLENIQIGDMLIVGAFPGHVMFVADIAQHEHTGEIIFLLAQSARPAQDIHIVKNRGDLGLSPWYSILSLKDKLKIEEWTFDKDKLKRF